MKSAPPPSNVPAIPEDERPLKYRIPLLLKVLFYSALLVGSVAGAIAYQNLEDIKAALIEEADARGRSIGENLSRAAADPLASGDLPTLGRLAEIGKGSSYAVVTDRDGKIMTHTDPRLLGQIYQPPGGLAPPADNESPRREIMFNGEKHFDFSVPVTTTLEGKTLRLGTAWVGLSTQFVNDRVNKTVAKVVQVAVAMLFAGFLGAFLLATTISRPVRRLVSGVDAVAAGNFGFRVKVTNHDELGELARAFNRMSHSLQEKEHLRDSFIRMSGSKRLAELAQTGKLNLGGERRVVSILFSDIANFTTISERLKPEDLVKQLNEYFSAMSLIIVTNNGMINKYIGDAVMAIWGAPESFGDDAFRSVRAALEMLDELKKLQDKWVQEDTAVFDIRIGIASGEVIAGNIGSSVRMEYTVIGDVVNTASRLEGLNKEYGTRLLVNESTWAQVKDRVKGKTVGAVKVKGKTEEIKVYTIESRR